MSSLSPLLLLTGFFGAGKTTLLTRWASDPAFEAKALSFVEMSRRKPPAGRVIVEVDALDGPLRILERLAADPLRERFRLEGIVAVIDAMDGGRILATQREARIQAVVADAIVITKSDLADAAGIERTTAELARINPDAEILRAVRGFPDPASVWDAAIAASGREVRRMRAALETTGEGGEEIRSFTVRFDGAVELSGFCMRLASFLEGNGGRVLRMKGLVRAEGRRGPAAIQAVGRKLYPVRALRSWPRGVEASTLAVIAQGVAEEEIRLGIEAAARPTPAGSSRPR